MSRRVQLSVDELESGMLLGADLCNHTGNLLLKKGERLSDDTILWLKRLGIETVSVLVEEQEDVITPEARKDIEEQLSHRFRRVAEVPLMCEIRQAFQRYLEGKSEH